MADCKPDSASAGTARAGSDEAAGLRSPASVRSSPMSVNSLSSGVAGGPADPVPRRRGQPWSAVEETQLTEAHQAGQGVTQLTALLDRSPCVIRKRPERLGLDATPRRSA